MIVERTDDISVPATDLALSAAKGVEFQGETFDTGVCHMALFRDPDGDALMLHRCYAPFEDGRLP